MRIVESSQQSPMSLFSAAILYYQDHLFRATLANLQTLQSRLVATGHITFFSCPRF
jgi:hypothetical protein